MIAGRDDLHLGRHLEPRADPYSYLIAGVGMLSAALVAFVGLWMSVSSPDGVTIAATAAMGAILVAMISLRMSATRGAVVEPLTLFCGVVFVYFVLHGAWLLSHQYGSLQGIYRPFRGSLGVAQEWLLAGCVALGLGYLGASRRLSERRPPRFELSNVSDALLSTMFLAGMLFQYLSFRAGGQYNAQNVLIFDTLGSGAFASFAIGVLKIERRACIRTRTRVLVYGLMLPIQGIWALSEGRKVGLVVVFVGILAIRQCVGRPVRIRWLIIAAIVFVGILTPLVNSARTSRAAPNAPITRALLHDAMAAVVHPAWFGPSTLSRGYNLIQQRTGGSEAVALAVAYTPSLRGFQHGRSLLAVPLGLVPHFVWRNKPFYSVGRDFSLIYAGQHIGQGLTVAPTIPGDLYMNFGGVGIVGGFFVIGCVLRWLTRLVEGGGASDYAILVYVTLLVQCLFVDQDLSVVVANSLTRVAAVTLFAWCIARFAPGRYSAGVHE